MIEYISRSGEPEAMNCPAFICDACREQVVGRGNILWASRIAKGVSRGSSPLFVAHKGRCDRAVKKLMEGMYPFDDGWLELWEEIGGFLAHLTNNLEHAFADDRDGTYAEHELTHPAGVVLPTFKTPGKTG